MGIIINSDYVLANGIIVNNVYASFKDSQITLDKIYNKVNNQNDYNDYRFILRCNYYIYSSKDFRFQEKPHIEMQSLEMYISKEDLLKDPYTIMYETLKMIYEDNTDDI